MSNNSCYYFCNDQTRTRAFSEARVLKLLLTDELAEQMEIANSKKEKELLTWEDVQKMKYSWNVVCEVLRLLPIGIGAFREAITDFNFAGFTIRQGMKVLQYRLIYTFCSIRTRVDHIFYSG